MRTRPQMFGYSTLLLVYLILSIHATAAEGQTDYTKAIQRFEQIIREELQHGSISGVSVALVDDQRVIYCNGFGFADKAQGVPAGPKTIYRAGSISKLFTAISVMQLVEQGKLELDSPITRYVPNLDVVNPFPEATPFTLRQLMCHRSGMVREAPVGGYFDDSQPGTARTVASLSGCVLIYPPNTKTKYSNSGVTIEGYVVEKVSGERFEEFQPRHLLGPMRMTSSAFISNPWVKTKLAKGYLPVADATGGHHEIEAPQFEFGILPAGNLYTTAEDLARFLACLFAEGRASGGPILKPSTLEQMFTPQVTQETNGFGLGFSIGSFQGHKTINHMGAVYGFTSMISGLPKEKLGVVVLCNDDIVVGAVRKLTSAGLSILLEARFGETTPEPPPTARVSIDDLAFFAGDYESESFWAEVRPGNGVLEVNLSGQRMILRPVGGPKFQANGRLASEAPVQFEHIANGRAASFRFMGGPFHRIDPKRVMEIPPEWKKFLGSYGPDFIPFIVSAKHGHLYAMTENEYDNRLWPISRTVFKMPPGIYTDEHVVFQLDAEGNVHGAVLANMPLKRKKN